LPQGVLMNSDALLSLAKEFDSSGAALITGVLAVFAFLAKTLTESALLARRAARSQLEILRALRRDVSETIEGYSAAYWPDKLPEADGQHPYTVMKLRFDAALASGEAYIPFVTSPTENVLWETVKPELHRFPARLMESITSYYYQDRLLSAMFNDLRTGEFKALSIPRQWLYVSSIFDAARKAIDISRKILFEIDQFEARQRTRQTAFWVLGSLAALAAILVVVKPP
jgi:hypothetical protein